MKKITALVQDLMFKAKIKEIAKQTDYRVEFVNKEVPFGDTNFIIVDLTHMDAFSILQKHANKCICYGPHVLQGLFVKARECGCLRTHPRSTFFSALKSLLEKN